MVGSKKRGRTERTENICQCSTLEMMDRDGAASHQCSWPEQQSTDSVLLSWDSKRWRDEGEEEKKDIPELGWKGERKRVDWREEMGEERKSGLLTNTFQHSMHQALESWDSTKTDGWRGRGERRMDEQHDERLKKKKKKIIADKFSQWWPPHCRVEAVGNIRDGKFRSQKDWRERGITKYLLL